MSNLECSNTVITLQRLFQCKTGFRVPLKNLLYLVKCSFKMYENLHKYVKLNYLSVGASCVKIRLSTVEISTFEFGLHFFRHPVLHQSI